MSKSRGTIGHRLTYYGFRIFEGAIGLLPLPVCFTLGKWLGRGARLVLAPYRKLARRNLALVAPRSGQ